MARLAHELAYKLLASLILWLLTISPGSSQTVADTHITGRGQSPVPRMSKLRQNVVVVEKGTKFTFPEELDCDVIEILGNARVSRDHDTSIRVVDIQVMPGGTLDIGTETDPVLKNVTITFKDTPLLAGVDGQLGPDPEQFGNGLVVFGQYIAHGRKLNKTWVQFSPTDAGATQLKLTEPVNWQVGDQLLIPDMRIAGRNVVDGQWRPMSLRREQPVTIAAIDGNVITLGKPLDFEHHAQAKELPYVANATRNIVLRSENANGTRAHAMFMETAHVNSYYASYVDMGRTLPKRLDNANLKTGHTGTNQVARYAVHWHHVHGHSDDGGYTGRFVGNFLDGSGIAKWGVVQHGTHDLLISDNVADRFVGSGFIAEDGYETRGRYVNNFAYWSHGNGINGKFNVINEQGENAPGSEGAGFWFHGSQHELLNNVAANCAVGYSFVHMAQVSNQRVPSVPGGRNDMNFVAETSMPIKSQGNKSITCNIGLETWRIPDGWQFDEFLALNSASQGVFMGNGEGGNLRLMNSRLVNDLKDAVNADAISNYGIHCSAAYTNSIYLENVVTEGFEVGVMDARTVVIIGGRLKNRAANINCSQFTHASFTFLAVDSAVFERMTPRTAHIILGQGGLVPNRYGEWWSGSTPRHRLINFNNSGKSYFLFENYAQRYVPATPSNASKGWFTCPEDGLTVGECFDKYGLAPNGYAAPEGCMALDGLVNGLAWEGTEVPPGPNRLVLKNPTSLAAWSPPNGQLLFERTGLAPGTPMYQIDGGRAMVAFQRQGETPGQWVGQGVTTHGTHVVKTWINGVPGSELTQQYFVGEETPPPTPDPPPAQNKPPVGRGLRRG